MIIENFTDTPNYIVKITQKMKVLLKLLIKQDLKEKYEYILKIASCFSSLPTNIISKIKKANNLDIILYNKEYVTNSCKERNVGDVNGHINFDDAIKSIIPKDVENGDSPMLPITMMRNELGILHGGSGAKIVKEVYMKAVQYLTENIKVQ